MKQVKRKIIPGPEDSSRHFGDRCRNRAGRVLLLLSARIDAAGEAGASKAFFENTVNGLHILILLPVRLLFCIIVVLL